MSDSNEVPVKKKRGRKPKVKTESELNNTEPKVPKKRGRKPKIKTDTEPKIPKKRGRKPKEPVVGIVPNKINEQESENIIIHLPI